MKLNLECPINNLGYGIASYNILKALDTLGVDISLWPIGQPEPSFILHKYLNNRVEWDNNAPSLKIWHQWDFASRIGKGKHIGFPIFELDRFTPYELTSLDSMDLLFVCSQWAADICDRYKLQTRVVPLGVDTSIFRPMMIKKTSTVRYLNVGKYEVRKGHDILPYLFAKAFSGTENYELWVAFDNVFMNSLEMQNVKTEYKNILGDKVKFIPRVSTQQELNLIMNKVDYGIFPARAEGWNLEALELMACGIPSIITNYHGHTEFCTNDNSYLVNIDEDELAQDNKWFNTNQLTNNGNWAKLGTNQIDQFVNHLRHTYRINSGELVSKQESCIKTAYKFSWLNSARKVIEYANE